MAYTMRPGMDNGSRQHMYGEGSCGMVLWTRRGMGPSPVHYSVQFTCHSNLNSSGEV
jgi:hypothetical protein